MASEPSKELIAEARRALYGGPGQHWFTMEDERRARDAARFAHEHAEREVAKALREYRAVPDWTWTPPTRGEGGGE